MLATTKFPVTTLILISLAVIASTSPLLGQRLVWDRTAIVEGQWWRLVTGHLVHLTPRHLWLDVLAVALAGWLIESCAQRQYARLAIMAAFAVGVFVFAFCPSVQVYGGLSGVAFAMFGYMAALCTHARSRWVGCVLLVLLSVKIGVEYATGHALFVGEGYVVLPAVHAVGAVCGLAKGAMKA
jgi:rhomboid family GlyGly-CTERM serine protease